MQAQSSTIADLNFLFQADKIQTLISAAKVEEVEPIWATIFAKVNIWNPHRRIFPSLRCDARTPKRYTFFKSSDLRF